jgi:hypothetical protein
VIVGFVAMLNVDGSSHGKINAGTVAGRNFIPWEGSVPWELFSKSITSPLKEKNPKLSP